MNHPLSYEISFGLPPQFSYILLLLISISGPFILSFDKKVAFYKEWKFLFKPVFFVSLGYVVWDILFTKIGIWQFNKSFLLNIFLSELPLEEYGFFIVVPYASAFVYSCLLAYFPTITNKYNSILNGTIILFSILLMAYAPLKMYTWTTLGLLVISIIYWQYKAPNRNIQYLYLAWLICIIPMLYVNGVLTGKPILIYNNLENCGIRIGTIPLEDFFYHLLYMVWMIHLFEYNKESTLTKRQNP
jgi:lycopene cyclase domain-containing protein